MKSQDNDKILALISNVRRLSRKYDDCKDLNRIYESDFNKVIHLAQNNVKVTNDPDAMRRAMKDMLDQHPNLRKQYQQAGIQSKIEKKNKNIKRLYRKAAMDCHPDRYDAMGIESENDRSDRIKQFQKIKSAYDNNDIGTLIASCIELEIDFKSLNFTDTWIIDNLRITAREIEEKISTLTSMFTWVWGTSFGNIDFRVKLLEGYLTQTGHPKISKTLLSDIILYHEEGGKKRKPGTRPKKILRP